MAACDKKQLLHEIAESRIYLLRVAAPLEDKDADFAPAPGMMTAVQQIAHVAHTVDWVTQGVQRPEGFDVDFAAHQQKIEAVTSLAEARAWLDRAYAGYTAWLEGASEDTLASEITGPLMGGFKRVSTVFGVVDHTAHHRGMISAYLRMLGKTPPMPYMSAEEIAALGG